MRQIGSRWSIRLLVGMIAKSTDHKTADSPSHSVGSVYSWLNEILKEIVSKLYFHRLLLGPTAANNYQITDL